MSQQVQKAKITTQNKNKNQQFPASAIIKALDVPSQSKIIHQAFKKEALAEKSNAKSQIQKKQKKDNYHIAKISKFSNQQIVNKQSKSEIKQSSLKPNRNIQQIFNKQVKRSQLKKGEKSSFDHGMAAKIINKKKSETSKIDNFPCSFCNKIITFQEIQSHHNSCQMAFTCQKCKDIFPEYLIFQHEQVCQQRMHKGQNQKPSYLKYYPKQEEQYKIPKNQEIGEDELYQMQFISQHPQIDPQIIRQHLQAEKEILNYYHPKEQGGEDLYLDQPNPKSTIIQGLNQSQMEDLIADFYHRGDSQNEDECSICSQKQEEGDIIIRLPCFHVFHKDCITPWLQVKSTCPTCKFNLRSS